MSVGAAPSASSRPAPVPARRRRAHPDARHPPAARPGLHLAPRALDRRSCRSPAGPASAALTTAKCGRPAELRQTRSTNYPPFWPAVRHNVIWLVVFIVIATPLGHALRRAARPRAPGTRVYQSLIFLPVMLSLALIGIIWELIYSPNYGLINTLIGRTRADEPDRLARQSEAQPVGGAGRGAAGGRPAYVMVLYLAGLKAVDPTLQRGRDRRRRQRLADVLAGHLPGDAPDQHRHRRRHGHRVAARVRPRLHHQRRAPTAWSCCPRWSRRTSSARLSRIGFGSALGVVLLVISLVPILFFLYNQFRSEEKSMTVAHRALGAGPQNRSHKKPRMSAGRLAAYSLHDRRDVLWLTPIAVRALHGAAALQRDARSTATCRCRTT